MNSTRKQMLLIGIKLLDTKYLLSKTHKPLRYKVSHVKDKGHNNNMYKVHPQDKMSSSFIQNECFFISTQIQSILEFLFPKEIFFLNSYFLFFIFLTTQRS